MTDFLIKRLPYELTSNAGLALVGQYFKRLGVSRRVDARFPVGLGGIANSDIIKSYLGLLVQGKNDFDAIEAFRKDAFFARCLGIGCVPSSPTMRQRMDANAPDWFELADEFNLALLGANYGGNKVELGALPCGYMPLDWDTFVMNNEGTKKELVGRTYQGVDGYTPSATYIGTHGYCLELDLRAGVAHSAKDTEHNLTRALAMAAKLTPLPLLLRADSGLCSAKIRAHINTLGKTLGRDAAFIIKWNPRSTPVETWAKIRVEDAKTVWCMERDGKRSCVWEDVLTEVDDTPQDYSENATPNTTPGTPSERQFKVRRICRLIERTVDKHGAKLLFPAYELEGWMSTLPAGFDVTQVIALYADHATHEQFHSEFKTDMDLERLPSGKFDTNYLVCALAAVALNILRIIGQSALTGKDAPLRHAAKRRRIKTVLQELMFKAGRMVKHAGRWVLGLGSNDTAQPVFERLYASLALKRASPA
jgi:hypothetical protein